MFDETFARGRWSSFCMLVLIASASSTYGSVCVSSVVDNSRLRRGGDDVVVEHKKNEWHYTSDRFEYNHPASPSFMCLSCVAR